LNRKKALFIGAHNDENEFCNGGLTRLLQKKGFEIVFLNIACGWRKGWELRSDDTLKKFAEQDIKAASILGAKKIILNYCKEKNFFTADDACISEIMNTASGIDPDVAFIHWPKDNHPDHVEVSMASMRALSYSTDCEIHAFEAGPYQTMMYFYPDFFIDITDFMDKVKESLSMFDQPTAKNQWLISEKEKVSYFRGHMSGFEYAEAYKLIRFPSPGKNQELLLPKLLGRYFKWAGNGQYPWGNQYFL
jgi:LmbE family N-acetylglucosaminyl deacetylase